MKNLTAIVGLLLFTLAAQAALPQPDLLMQIYFAGAQKISAEHNSTAFTNEFCSTEALALRAQTAGKLSAWLSGWLQMNLDVSVADGAAKLRPLFDDLQSSEFFLETREAVNGKVETAIAIQLPPARAQIWQANLRPFFTAASFKSTGGWLIFDSNPSLMGLGNRLAQKISTPPPGWFDLDVNWPRLAQWYPEFKALGLPETQLTVTAPDNNFRINGKFFFPENLALNLEPWRVPTNTLHQPFDSFTAIRGFASWYQSQSWAQPYQLTPVPNQIFFWGLPSFPFQTYAAVPVPNAGNALSQAYARLAPVFATENARDYFMSPITPEMTNNEIDFTGMPFIAPHLVALTEAAGPFLFLETFPNTPRSKPLPPELFQRLAIKNLVFYHWEITAGRILQLLNVSQFGLMITSHKQLEADSASFKWLQRIGGGLGNTDTEITLSGPAEFAFARNAPGIFTAPELFTLANWLEAKNFPGCDIKMPPRSPRMRQHMPQQQRAISTPAPATGQ